MGLLSYQPSYRVFLFDLFCSSMPCKGFFGLCGVNTKLKTKNRPVVANYKIFLGRDGAPLVRGPCFPLKDGLEVTVFSLFCKETPFLRVKLFKAYQDYLISQIAILQKVTKFSCFYF